MTDRRSSVCKRWKEIDGVRTPCNLQRDHEGQCSWDHSIPEGNPIRDVGPYRDDGQALTQFSWWRFGMPLVNADVAVAMVLEATTIGMVETSEFERAYLQVHGVDPVLATIVHGWIIRAAHPNARLPVGPVAQLPPLGTVAQHADPDTPA